MSLIAVIELVCETVVDQRYSLVQVQYCLETEKDDLIFNMVLDWKPV